MSQGIFIRGWTALADNRPAKSISCYMAFDYFSRPPIG